MAYNAPGGAFDVTGSMVYAVQKSCIHASAVAVFVEWWIVVFVDNVSFHRGICTLGASLFLSSGHYAGLQCDTGEVI